MGTHNVADRLRGYIGSEHGMIGYDQINENGGVLGLDSSAKIKQTQIPDLEIHSQTPQVLTGAGAASITTHRTHLITAGVGDVITLADGVEGQEKVLFLTTLTNVGDTSVITPASLPVGLSTITLNKAYDSIGLMFSNGTWYVIGGFGASVV